MRLLTILSILLDYPDEELKTHLPDLESLIDHDDSITPRERDGMCRVLRWMRNSDLISLQQHYVQIFDLAQGNTLHLTYHTHGDDRNRGPALIDLIEHYRAHGVEIPDRELPDYLPLVLEYAAMQDPMARRMFLHKFSSALASLGDSLEAADTPYASLLRMVESQARLVDSKIDANEQQAAHR